MSTNPSYENPTRGILLMILASLCFSIMSALIKSLAQEVPPEQISLMRSLVMMIILMPWMKWKGIPLLGTHYRPLIGRGLFGGLNMILGMYVFQNIPLTTATMLGQLTPVFVAVLSVFFLKENVTPRMWGAIILAWLGVAMFAKPSSQVESLYVLLALVCCLMGAIAYTTIRNLSQQESPYTVIAYLGFLSVLMTLPFASTFVELSVYQLWVVVMVGVVGTFAQVFMTWSYFYAPASLVSPYSMTIPLFAGIWGYLYWQEVPDTWTIVGASLILIANWDLFRQKIKKDTGIKTA